MNKGLYGLGRPGNAQATVIGVQGNAYNVSVLNVPFAAAPSVGAATEALAAQPVDVVVFNASGGTDSGTSIKWWYGPDTGQLTAIGAGVMSPDDTSRFHMWPFLVPAGNKLYVGGTRGLASPTPITGPVQFQYVQSPSRALRRACRRSYVSPLNGSGAISIPDATNPSPWYQFAREQDFQSPGAVYRVPDLGVWAAATHVELGTGASGSQAVAASISLPDPRVREQGGGVPYSSLFPALTTEARSGLLITPADWWIRLYSTAGAVSTSFHVPLLVAV